MIQSEEKSRRNEKTEARTGKNRKLEKTKQKTNTGIREWEKGRTKFKKVIASEYFGRFVKQKRRN